MINRILSVLFLTILFKQEKKRKSVDTFLDFSPESIKGGIKVKDMKTMRLFKCCHEEGILLYIASYLFVASAFILIGACSYSNIRDDRGDTQGVQGEIVIKLKSGKFEIKPTEYKSQEKIQKGEIIIMKGFESTSSPGDPVLPFQIYDVAVPPNIDWETLKLTVKDVNTTSLPGKHIILPAPPTIMHYHDDERHIDSDKGSDIKEYEAFIDWGEGKEIVNGRNMKVYGKKVFFPEEPVKILATSQMRKWKFIRVGFNPVQYNPVDETLRLIQSAQVHITFERIGIKVFRTDPILEDTLMDDEAEKRFINYKEALEWYRYVPNLQLRNDVQDPDYVIITTNAIKYNSSKLASFVTHKIALGHSVRVVTEDDFGSVRGQHPNGTAEKIRQWLKDNYGPLGIQYVLLIGNPDPDDPALLDDTVGDIPMKMCFGAVEFSNLGYIELPTDYFYADLTGNWDLDGDGLYGERHDYGSPITPDPTIDPETFSVRWTGRIRIDTDGIYYFGTFSDDGMRVIIDGTIIIENWFAHLPTVDYGSIALTAGMHDIEIHYFNNTHDAIVKLYWKPPGESRFNLITGNYLYHLVGTEYLPMGLDGEYFNNSDFTASALTRVDRDINFVWVTGDNGIGGPDFSPEVYVGRIPVYNADYTTLDSILQKIINYETGAVPAWRRKLLTAQVEWFPNMPDQSDWRLGEALKSNLADPLGFTTYRLYESDFGLVPPPECTDINPIDRDPSAPCNMLQEWVNGGGYGILAWSAHGWAGGASALINSSDSSYLDDSKPLFTFQNSCLNGQPEFNNNLGYSLLKQGAIATVSATRPVGPLSRFLNPNPLSGDAANQAYHYAMRIMQDSDAGHALYITKANISPTGYWFLKMWFNLYGDPSVSLLRSGVPLMPWTRQFGTSQADRGNGIAADSNGNTYVTGFTLGDLAQPVKGFVDVFIGKYDISGNRLWMHQFGGTRGWEQGHSIAVDSKSNSYITGYTEGDIEGANAGSKDVIIAKYNASGDRHWIHQFGTNNYDIGNDIAVDSDGTSYVIGRTAGDLGRTNAGSDDVFIAKYDANGNQQWLEQFGTSEWDVGEGIAVDSNGFIYITGRTEGAFEGTNNGLQDIFIAKYDANGNQQWMHQLHTDNSEGGYEIAVDSNGNSYITGYTTGDLAGFNGGVYDIFAAKFDTNGSQQWITQLGTPNKDIGRGIAVDASGTLFIAGDTCESAGNKVTWCYIPIYKLNNSGEQIGMDEIYSQGLETGRDICVDSTGSIYITGDTTGDIGGMNAGGSDIYILHHVQ